MSNPKICSGCIRAIDPGKETVYVSHAKDQKNDTPMGFCNYRCLAMWAIGKGWPKS